jgi:hypothetical protein
LWYRPPIQPPGTQVGKKAADEEIESEAAVMANFDFLQNDIEGEEDDDMDDGGSADDESDEREEYCNERRLIKKPKTGLLFMLSNQVNSFYGNLSSFLTFPTFPFPISLSHHSILSILSLKSNIPSPPHTPLILGNTPSICPSLF